MEYFLHFPSKKTIQTERVSDPNPVFLPGFGSDSGFQISLDPDPVSAPGSLSEKSAVRALNVIY